MKCSSCKITQFQAMEDEIRRLRALVVNISGSPVKEITFALVVVAYEPISTNKIEESTEKCLKEEFTLNWV